MTARSEQKTQSHRAGGPCEHLVVKLDVQRRVIVWTSQCCSKAAGEAEFHWFDADSGEPVRHEHDKAA